MTSGKPRLAVGITVLVPIENVIDYTSVGQVLI